MPSGSNLSGRGSKPTPLLSETSHSGIPQHMAQDAKRAKDLLYSNTTTPDSVPRQREVPRLPPNTTREKFDSAMAELRERLGASNVEINDKPLVDGWYMEHPYVFGLPLEIMQWCNTSTIKPQHYIRHSNTVQKYTRCIPYRGPGRDGLQRRCISIQHRGSASCRFLGEQTPYSHLPNLHGKKHRIRWSSPSRSWIRCA